MHLDPDLFVHDSDKAALKALKAIPGFSAFLKAYMNIWNERQFRIENMSSNLRVSQRQMKKYHDLLPPICEKLGIEVPDMFLKLDVRPNAYTYGDTNPFIVLTTGLFETLPEELIPTVIAHECGHIACHHTMFRTMGYLILNGTVDFPLLTFPLKIAFAYWMRCSEFSADRAAVIYDGSADRTIEMCMRFSGYDKDLDAQADVDAFIEQALEYRELVSDSKFNKTLEFLMYNQIDHPLNAVRAYEAREWARSSQYQQLAGYLRAGESGQAGSVPTPRPAKQYVGMDRHAVAEELREAGFTNITVVKDPEKGLLTKPGQVMRLSVNGDSDFAQSAWYPAGAPVVIVYYDAPTAEELAAAHPGQIQVPCSSKKCVGRDYREIADAFTAAGFTRVLPSAQSVKKGLFTKDMAVTKVTIDGRSQFDEQSWYAPDAVVRILYNDIQEG